MNDSGSRSVAQPVKRLTLVLARLRKPVIVVAAIGTVLGGLAGYVTMYRTVASTPPSARDTAAQDHPVTDAISILVLPLANQTGDAAKAYVADALTTAITSDLSRIQDAVIVPPVTAVALQEKKLTLQQMGTEARVRFVLQGGASLSGERLRVNVQLSDTRSGHQLWSQAFEAPMGDLFALQDDLTLRIRTSVGPQMVLVAAREAQAREKSPQVADLILRLRALDLQQQSVANHKQREALARKALAIDPKSLYARASLATTQLLLASNFFNELGLESNGRGLLFAQAAAEAKQVLARDPEHVRMLRLLASDAEVRGDFDTARKLYERALEIDPRNAATYVNVGGMLLNSLGRSQEARELLLKALQLPSYLPPAMTYAALSEVAAVQGKYDEAIEWGEKSVQANPDHGLTRANLAVAYAMKGDERRARALTAELLQRHPGYRATFPENPWPGNEAAFREYWGRVIPAARLAGLPIRE
jgi:TolB-like protein/Flp pilus assembly protein TadD